MKIAMVTPWHVRCGIATYSEAVAYALSKQGVEVYVTRLNRFGRRSVPFFETFATRRTPKVDLVHIQHEYGLYAGGEGLFYSMLRRKQGVTPIVTTLHAVGIPTADEIVVGNSDAIIVHNTWCKERLLAESTLIQHGVDPVEPMPMEEAKQKMGLKGPVITVFGFVGPYKGIEQAIRTIGLEFPNVNLVVAGGWHIDLETSYIAQLKQLADSVAPGQVRWPGWVKPEDLPMVFGATDVGLYCNRYMTESGALLTVLGYGKCMLAKDLSPNKEREALGALKTYKTDADLILGLEELLQNPELRQKYEEGARKYSLDNSWEKVAKKHIDLYESLV